MYFRFLFKDVSDVYRACAGSGVYEYRIREKKSCAKPATGGRSGFFPKERIKCGFGVPFWKRQKETTGIRGLF